VNEPIDHEANVAAAGDAAAAPASAPDTARPPPPGADPTLAQMLRHLRRANEVAQRAQRAGHHPFGAVLVGPDHETVLSEQGNVDTVNHAEAVLARMASVAFSPEELWGCTLYTTVEPCCMCAGTLYWANVGRVVYGVSESTLLQFTGDHPENPTLDLPCREVFTRGQKDVRVWGPLAEVEDEIGALHRTFWSAPAPAGERRGG
jgi:tRNA(Arg) A34 adenosine deaminase TadA